MGARLVPKYTLLLSLLVSATILFAFVVERVAYNAQIRHFEPRRAIITSSKPAATEAGRYVSLCAARMNGYHRTGNHLFMLAAMLYVAERTGRQVIMKPTGWCLDDAFNIDITRFNASVGVPRPVRNLRPRGIYNPDPLLDNVKKLTAINETTLGLCGLYQTWRYADAVAMTLRSLLRFKQDARREAFLDVNRPTGWPTGTYFRVGIHVRRGDFLTAGSKAWGLTVITEQYLNNSMRYFKSRHDRVHFIVATDDIKWTKNALASVFGIGNSTADSLQLDRQLNVDNSTVVTLSVDQTTAIDLAILAACDALIISTGSFGWWAAWLANKTTVYYENWPRRGTTLARQLNRKTLFPARWIGMT